MTTQGARHWSDCPADCTTVHPEAAPALPRTLNDIMQFDHVISNLHGVITDAPDTIRAPELRDDKLPEDSGWILYTNGYSGQCGYSGPMMHPSEYIGGRLERDIRRESGYYVALVNLTDDDENTEWAVAWRPFDPSPCWHVASNRPGYLPESDVACFGTRDDAVSYLTSEMQEWADRDDEDNDAYVAETVPPSEHSDDDLGSTRATVDAILTDDGPDAPGMTDDYSATINDNDDRPMVWFLARVANCDHTDCEHES